MSDLKVVPINIEMTHFDYDSAFIKTESFAQKVVLVLNTWKKEFVYDEKKGIDYETIMSENFPHQVLESFFLFSLKENIEDFNTITEWKIDYNQLKSTAYISFIAHSKSGETVYIENYQI